MKKSIYTGRFAPSPTGPLHLGSLATALGSYLDARVHNGKWLLRLEDIDEQRCSVEFSSQIQQALQAHGLVWDEPPWIQTMRQTHYAQALDQLANQGYTYPCACTRQEIDQANPDRQMGQNRIYPGTCSRGMPPGRQARAIRFRCPKKTIAWTDHRLGHFSECLQKTSGDFVLARTDGSWTYHLAVVVDDIASGVTHIVRGDDLCDTTARQIALCEALNQKTPAYWHLPVVLANDGQKLSKQTGAQALALEKPMDNLNRVWKHFGLQRIESDAPAAWLTQAATVWANYRSSERFDSKTR